MEVLSSSRLASTEGAGVEEGISVVVVVDVVGTGLGAFVMLGAGLGSCVMLGTGLAVGTGVGSSDPEVWAGGAVDTEGSGVGARVFGGGPGGSDGSGVGTVGQVLEGHAVGTGVASTAGQEIMSHSQ